MRSIARSKRNTGLVLGLLVVLGTIIVWLAPMEQTLGEGIRAVYVHVAFIWTGMLGLLIGSILGMAVVATGRERLEAWSQTLVWIALLFFAGGLAMSVVAARVNWGAVFWQEPRTNAALQLLAFAVIVQGLNTLPIPTRLKGALRVVPLLLMVWITWSTPLVLHPRNPARTSSSTGIRLTFLSLFILSTLAATWLVVYARSRIEKLPAATDGRRPISDKRQSTPVP